MFVNYVGKPLYGEVPYKNLSGFILELGPVSINCVGKPVLITVLFVTIPRFTVEKSLMRGAVWESFVTDSSLRSHGRSHSGDKLYVCKPCGKSFTYSCSPP